MGKNKLIEVEGTALPSLGTHEALAFAASVVGFSRTPTVVLRRDLRVKLANRAFLEKYRLEPEDVENRLFLDLGTARCNFSGFRIALERAATFRGAVSRKKFQRELFQQDGAAFSGGIRFVQLAGEKLILVALGEKQQLRRTGAADSAQLEKTNRMLKSAMVGREQVESALHVSEQALLRSREQLRQLSASLMNAQDAERRRVSRELHDDLSQKVARLQFEIETLEHQVPFADVVAAKARLRDVGRQAGGLSNDLRRVAHQLHPATLDHLGLSIALRAYAEEFSRSTAIPVKFTSLFVPRKIPMELASGLYRIAQEALRNVGKHSGNAQVEIVLARAPEGLALFIRDNGEGFDLGEARAKGGLGLIGMQERVRLLEGSLTVETRPGKGVLITVQCPLPGEEECAVPG